MRKLRIYCSKTMNIISVPFVRYKFKVFVNSNRTYIHLSSLTVLSHCTAEYSALLLIPSPHIIFLYHFSVFIVFLYYIILPYNTSFHYSNFTNKKLKTQKGKTYNYGSIVLGRSVLSSKIHYFYNEVTKILCYLY